VPVIHAAQSLSILEIAAELQRLQALGAAGRLGEAELTGGTFTLSNIGSIGGTYASPVILTPQVSCMLVLHVCSGVAASLIVYQTLLGHFSELQDSQHRYGYRTASFRTAV
jgi:2-oxoacid dehydrogenases acyltransferase (catalytic domain)